MCPHETGASIVLYRRAYGCTRRWDGVTFGGDEAKILTFSDSGDVSLHSLPQQDPKIGWLSSAAWIKCGTVEDDPLGAGLEYDRLPLT
ncbi:hypothetical protein GCM10027176_23960 [Actinoallomurus bryophytorum]